MTSPRVLTGARLSELAACPRRCACRIQGHEPAPFSKQTERYLTRGRLFQRYVELQFQSKYDVASIESERPIPWGDGWTGHADIYVRPEKLLVEVVSTVGGNIDHKIRQAQLYLLHDREAESAAVYVVDPSSLEREDLFPVFLTPEIEAELALSVQEMVNVSAGADLPPCVHDTPTACRFSGCPFTETAWADWEQPDLTDSPELVGMVAEWWRADRAVKEHEAHAEEFKTARDAMKDSLCEILPAGEDVKAGPFAVRRTLVKGRETFSLSRARKAGAWVGAFDETLGPFVSVSESHSRLSIKRVTDEELPAPSGSAWGDSPF